MLTASSLGAGAGAAATGAWAGAGAGAGAGTGAGAGAAATGAGCTSAALTSAAAEVLSATATDGTVSQADISSASVSIEHLDILFMVHPYVLFSSEQAADSSERLPGVAGRNLFRSCRIRLLFSPLAKQLTQGNAPSFSRVIGRQLRFFNFGPPQNPHFGRKPGGKSVP